MSKIFFSLIPEYFKVTPKQEEIFKKITEKHLVRKVKKTRCLGPSELQGFKPATIIIDEAIKINTMKARQCGMSATIDEHHSQILSNKFLQDNDEWFLNDNDEPETENRTDNNFLSGCYASQGD